MEEFSSKKFQGDMTAKELIKTDKNNISNQQFRIAVTRFIAGLEKGTEDSRESITAETKELRNSHE